MRCMGRNRPRTFCGYRARIRRFRGAYYYPAASGTYGGTRLYFTVVTFDGGARLRLGRSNVGFIAGLYQEMRSLHPGNRAAQMIRVAPYVGLQIRQLPEVGVGLGLGVGLGGGAGVGAGLGVAVGGTLTAFPPEPLH